MRTKTLLLAGAALAVSLATSQAQVYSANIVGYANVVLAGNGAFTLVANPFDDGNGNYATNLLNSALPKKSQYEIWNGATFASVQKTGSPAAWPPTASDQVPPGIGFFVQNGSVGSSAPALTNTFVGSVIVAVGNSVTNAEPIGFSLQGSPIPYAGNITILNQNGGDANMDFGGPLTKKSVIETWNGITFASVQKTGSPALWGGTVAISVGQGFFVQNLNGPATNVVETLAP